MRQFYSGGFLYNVRSQKVLLHQRDNQTQNNPSKWAFFGGLNNKGETPIKTFLREIYEELGVRLDLSQINPLCDYFNPDFQTHRYVSYGEVEKTTHNLKLTEGKSIGWFKLDDALKLDLSKRTRQDLHLFGKKMWRK